MTSYLRTVVPLLASVVTIAACAKKMPPQTAATPAAAPSAPRAPSEDSIEAARRDSLARAQQLAGRMAAAATARKTITVTIYFDFDKSDLTDQAKTLLDQKVPILDVNSALRIRVAGNCDERGSDEYNLALGQRRAAAAKRYLTDHGVDASRVDLISYGKERPVASGHDEAAWSQNRNDRFEIVSGGETLQMARQ